MLNLASIVLQNDDGSGLLAGLFSGVGLICWLIVVIIVIAGFWKVYAKAGQPGWAAIIPIYNIWVLLKIIGRPGWWLILYFIPFINIIVYFINAIDLAKSFGKGAGYGIILLGFLSGIGHLILGFGDAEYVGPAAA